MQLTKKSNAPSIIDVVGLASPTLSAGILLKIFLAALAVRWAYSTTIFFFMGDPGLETLDSTTYVAYAQDLAKNLRAGTVTGSHWFGDNTYTMPLFDWLSALPFVVFGNAYGTFAYVLMEGVFDAGTCLAVYGIASRLSPRVALASAIFAIVNPTQIVLSGLFYTDTPFVFFVASAFYASFRWTEVPSRRNALFLGLSLGCAALMRAVIVPWALFLLATIAVRVLFRKLPLRQLASLATALLALCLCVSVIIAKNYTKYGTANLTSQGGVHLALTVVPLAREMQDRTPFTTTSSEMEARTIDRFGPHSSDPFEQSGRYTIIAKEALADIGLKPIVKSWLSGMAINLASPAILLSPPVSQIPRRGFYDTPGASFFDKAFNYVFRSGQLTYTVLLLAGAIGLAGLRLLQLIGAAWLSRRTANWPALFLIASWFGYILLVNGPVASPKYRLPLEPLCNILSGAGLVAIRDRRAHAKSRSTA
jgi:4-amino-4-deoxy-L-arabinose transferase-like glycosyltransferase